MTLASVPYGRRQEFKVADLKLAGFIDENDLEIEIGIKVLTLLQVFHTDPLSLRHILKFLWRQFSVDLAAQTCPPDLGGNPIRHRADGEHGVHCPELLLAAPVPNVG